MPQREEVTSVTELLDRIDAAAEAHERTSMADVLDAVGHRSFGPVLLLFLDRWSRPRASAMTRGAGFFVAAVACTLIAAATPLMEVVPFSVKRGGHRDYRVWPGTDCV